jgi:mono/diheme cytochrome c family protein
MTGPDELKTVSTDDGTEVIDLHEPIYREMAEPRDGYEPMPTWLVFLCLGIMGFGGWYLGMFSGGFRPDTYSETGWGARAPAAAAAPAAVDPMVLGRRVYNNCMACHQQNGQGVAGNYPPLAGSEWVGGSDDLLAALLLHGLEGSVTVRGASYNQVMPSWSHLSDQQIAAVLTYVRGSFGNSAGAVEPDLVAAVRQQTSDRARPWTADELKAFRVEVAPATTPDGQAESGGHDTVKARS